MMWSHRSVIHSKDYAKPNTSDQYLTLPVLIVQVIVQEGGLKRDLLVGVVGPTHDVHRVPGEIRHTVGYHACNGNIIHWDASDKQNLIEGDVLISLV